MKLRDINVLIKPASSLCDLRCAYCFYRDEAEHRDIPSYGLMTHETACVLISRALAHTSRSCTFLFQGGEPTLSGLDFFRYFVSEVQRQNEHAIEVHYALQTNGQSIDQQWAEFFRENNFLVGISLDGTAEMHDRLRGKGSHKKAMHSIELLKKYGVEFNILTVVTAGTARSTEAMYNFFKRRGLYYQQYIPCIDAVGGESFLSADEYGKFLIRLFRFWERDAVSAHPVYIRFFDELALMLLGNRPGSCGMSGVCSLQYVIESNGDVYPCDFYCMDEYLLGNVVEDDFDAVDARRNDICFREESSHIASECRTCPYFALCRGGCRRDRDNFCDNCDNNEIRLNRLCRGYKMFFSECLQDLQALVRRSTGR
jgi:uncharacterized protein